MLILDQPLQPVVMEVRAQREERQALLAQVHLEHWAEQVERAVRVVLDTRAVSWHLTPLEI
jgi:hypothetical protein